MCTILAQSLCTVWFQHFALTSFQPTLLSTPQRSGQNICCLSTPNGLVKIYAAGPVSIVSYLGQKFDLLTQIRKG